MAIRLIIRQGIAAFGFGAQSQSHMLGARDAPSQTGEIGDLAFFQLQFDFADGLAVLSGLHLAMVDRHLDKTVAAFDRIAGAINRCLEYWAQFAPLLPGGVFCQGGMARQAAVGLRAGEFFFPFLAIGGPTRALYSLDIMLTDPADPERETLVAQRAFGGVEIDRYQPVALGGLAGQALQPAVEHAQHARRNLEFQLNFAGHLSSLGPNE